MKIQRGDRVQLHYEAQLEDGTVFDRSEGGQPVEFNVGAGEVITGIDEALPGMEPGKHKLTVEADKAYGPRREDLVQQVPIEILEDSTVNPGEAVELEAADGTVLNALVTDVDEQTVTFDLNHPLAGHTITFYLDILSVRPAA